MPKKPIWGDIVWPSKPQIPKPTPKPPSLIADLWARIKKFVLPEETMSLKIAFDNVRNYLICAGVIAALGASRRVMSDSAENVLPIGLAFFVLLFLGANALQSVLIVFRLTERIGRLPKEIRPKWSWWQRRGARLLLAIIFAPIIVAAYRSFAALIAWVLSGGGRGPGL